MEKPTTKRFDEDDVLEAQAALQLLTQGPNGGVWGLFDRILAQEREDKVSIALFDDKTSKKFYAGYITAIDMLRGMPALLLTMADQIKEARDAEARRQAAVRQHIERELNQESEASVL